MLDSARLGFSSVCDMNLFKCRWFYLGTMSRVVFLGVFFSVFMHFLAVFMSGSDEFVFTYLLFVLSKFMTILSPLSFMMLSVFLYFA